MIAKNALYRCAFNAVVDVQMTAKLARGLFACVARDVMIVNERRLFRRTSRHYVSRLWIASASSIVRTSDLHTKLIYTRLVASLVAHQCIACVAGVNGEGEGEQERGRKMRDSFTPSTQANQYTAF